MAIYLWTLVLLFLASLIKMFSNRKIEVRIAFVLFFFGFFFSLYTNMFRNMIGGYDVFVYAFYFENIGNFGNYFDYEEGFYYFTKLIYSVSDNRFVYFSIIAFIYTFFVYFIAHKISKRYCFFIFFLIFCKFYFYSFVYLRQILSVVLVWFGTIYLSEGKKTPFVLLVILGSLFHISAVISFVFLLFNLKYKVKVFFIVFILSISFLVVPLDSVLTFIRIDKFHEYLGRDYNLFYLIEAIIVFMLLLFNRKSIVGLGKKGNFYFNLTMFYIYVGMIATTYSGLSRFSWYPFLGLVVCLGTYLMQGQRDLKKFMLFFSISIYFIFIFLRIMIVRDGGDMMPYESIFSESIRNSQFAEEQ